MIDIIACRYLKNLGSKDAPEIFIFYTGSLLIPAADPYRVVMINIIANALLYDFDGHSDVFLDGGGFHDGTDRFCDSSLFPDHLAHIFLGNLEFKNDAVIVFHLVDADFVRIIHEGSCDRFEKFLHILYLPGLIDKIQYFINY